MMNENEAASIMFANLRGSKTKPSGILQFAEACRYFYEKFGSYAKVADFFKASRTMITQIDKLNDLSDEAKKLVEKAGIDRSFQAYRLDTKIQAEALKEMLSLRANPDARLFVDYLLENIDLSVKEAKRRFLKTRPKIKRVHIVAVPLEDEVYSKLSKLAGRKKTTIHRLLTESAEQLVHV